MANNISVAVADNDTIRSGRDPIVTTSPPVSIATGNPVSVSEVVVAPTAGVVVLGAAAVVGVAVSSAVVVVDPPHPAIANATTSNRVDRQRLDPNWHLLSFEERSLDRQDSRRPNQP
jgi:hypothetical protein